MLDEAFLKLKGNLEPTDSFAGLIQQHHTAVRSVVQNSRSGVETKLIGSLARKTRIQPREADTFDIDILVVLGRFGAWTSSGITPQQAEQTVQGILEDTSRYASLEPSVDSPTVAFEYNDGIKVELVPAYKDGIGQSPSGIAHTPVDRGYWIPKSGRWELADYDHETKHISEVNQTSGEALVPFIKMLKALRREYFPDLGSFPLEILAADLLPGIMAYNVGHGILNSWPVLITSFFVVADEPLHGPIRIPESNSQPIILTPAVQASTSTMFKKLRDYCLAVSSRSTERAKLEGWKELFKEALPLS